MGYETILYEETDGYATITLNRPDKLNAFTKGMHHELRRAVARASDAAGIRALLLTGAGRAFSAGQDLTERKLTAEGPPPDLGQGLKERYNPLVHTLRDLEMPVVCAVNGIAAGAGCNVALACDIVLAARSASFLQAFARIGLVPDAGGTYHLPRLVGHARAMGMALLAEPIPAETAEAWGLIWKCLDDEALMDEARATARRLAQGPTTAYALAKQGLNASLTNSLDDQLELERDLQRIAGHTTDYVEGITAFLEKRPARFTGR